eukprot:658901-Pelagomonas_calceolata.AAC.2
MPSVPSHAKCAECAMPCRVCQVCHAMPRVPCHACPACKRTNWAAYMDGSSIIMPEHAQHREKLQACHAMPCTCHIFLDKTGTVYFLFSFCKTQASGVAGYTRSKAGTSTINTPDNKTDTLYFCN